MRANAPTPAADADGKYNIACGNFFLLSSWISSTQKNKSGCADVVPESDIQYGSRDDSRFRYCLKQMDDPIALKIISNARKGDINHFLKSNEEYFVDSGKMGNPPPSHVIKQGHS